MTGISTASELSSQDLAKLTVPQLKALCKERQIVGYSKLAKAGLLLKLGELEHNAASRSSEKTELAVRSEKNKPSAPGLVDPIIANESNPPLIAASNVPQNPYPGTQTTRKDSSSRRIGQQHSARDPVIAASTTKIKRSAPVSTSDVSTQKRARLDSAVNTRHGPLPVDVGPTSHDTASALPDMLKNTTSFQKNKGSTGFAECAAPQRSSIPSAKSQPTIAKPRAPVHLLRPSDPKAHIPKDTLLPLGVNRAKTRIEAPVLRYLDLPIPLSLAPLANITLPPRISERKRVQRWAIILSALSNEDRRVCVFVSRSIRYAVYLSAAHILAQRYRGQRLKEVTTRYSPVMTNMWPYLLQRRAEVLSRRAAYKASFVGQYFGSFEPLSEHVWTSSDNEKQVSIALRVLITRLWFTLSVGGSGQDSSAWMKAVIIDVKEIVPGEIWAVTLKKLTENKTKKKETCYVLESTCEVIGHPPAVPTALKPDQATHENIRADWSNYIAGVISSSRLSSTRPVPSISQQLKWANYEEFDRGMSKLWLQQIVTQGDTGVVKREIAERYIMASVVGNSISGRWKSSHQMAQDFAGLPNTFSESNSKSTPQRVNLYLPIHHHIESVHLVAPNGEPLHPALATVQTPGREYYILKDNGMQIGCEEEGVAAVWMKVLGCNNQGIAVAGL
ncbi:hypothetical protein BJ138DRAFT_1007994 [Hygrophoropsis aurantiaca]|uniref:Uncharacterized protein n=1 Tax=Hygrophoropsis aurantiaca TaxID=72124 RepID=A0ACB8ADL8_9AGAM|nr:hypothetical protein BJ138DRAFT_1007994 [Hygrophoropsis aurantiaca]